MREVVAKVTLHGEWVGSLICIEAVTAPSAWVGLNQDRATTERNRLTGWNKRRKREPPSPAVAVARWAPAPSSNSERNGSCTSPNRQFGERIATRRGAHVTTHASYRLTQSEAFLRAPFDAIEEARKGNQYALALLSAARSLYLAECMPNELERTEGVLHVWRAREALCDRGRRGQGSTDQHWDRLVITLRLKGELLRLGYVREEVDETFELVEKLRGKRPKTPT